VSKQPYLSPNQQDLLLAALNSQVVPARASQPNSSGGELIEHRLLEPGSTQPTMATDNSGLLYLGPHDADLDQFDVDFTPEGDFLDGDQSFDFDNADLGGDMIGSIPGQHEKRKNSEEDSPEEGEAKRQEIQDGERSAKKPGRKPLTSEPTTKRKAQNRAAQRAFRERKEKHLKDLETKVAELEKANEADRHENGLLKAQMERMRVELLEYRKRFSMQSGSNRSPTLASSNGQSRSLSGSYGNNFQFDFPKFGELPGSQMFGNQTTAQAAVSPSEKQNSVTPASARSFSTSSAAQGVSRDSRQGSAGRSLSPQNAQPVASFGNTPATLAGFDGSFPLYSTSENMHGFADTLPQMDANDLGDLFSPSILKSASVSGYFNEPKLNPSPPSQQTYSADHGGDNNAGLERVFQFNGGSNASDSTSPSASSTSQWNTNGIGNSSCETSPEPYHDSPALKDKAPDASAPTSRQNSYETQPQVSSNKNGAPLGTVFNFGNIDYSAPSMAGFDPVLFGDYRDSQDAVIGAGDFTGGFFDDALNSAPFDYGSPSNLFGILQSPQPTQPAITPNKDATKASAPSKHLLAEIEKARDGGDDDYGLPTSLAKTTENQSKLISCNNIWNQLQSNPDFQEGKFDLDGLCSELRAKARCSESGVMVDQNHVDAALRKLGSKGADGKKMGGNTQ